MGGNSSPVKVIKKATDRFITATGNVGEGLAQGDFSKAFKNIGYATEEFTKGVTGITSFKAGVGGVADITGATAAQQGLNAQIEQGRADARRQALISDELARNEGGEGARVSLNTGRNRRLYNQSATGISGAGSSKGTGVQS